MFDYLRNLTKSDAEKQQEALNAYLDNALTPQETRRFEQHVAQNPDLQAQVAQLRGLKQQMRGLPQRRVPRNFMLDPQKYGRPQSTLLIQAYPFLRSATALTAFFFVIALAANVFLGDFNGSPMTESASESSNIAELSVEETVAEETAVEEGEMVEVTRVVTEQVMATTVTEFVEEAAVAMDEAAAPPEPQSEGAGIETQRESAPAAEMPIDATAMIAGTTKFDEADMAASNDLEVPASEESAEDLDPAITIPQAAATQVAATKIAEQISSDESAQQAADSVSNRDLSEETIEQVRSVMDPWLVATLLLGVLLLILLLLTLLTRRRL